MCYIYIYIGPVDPAIIAKFLVRLWCDYTRIIICIYARGTTDTRGGDFKSYNRKSLRRFWPLRQPTHNHKMYYIRACVCVFMCDIYSVMCMCVYRKRVCICIILHIYAVLECRRVQGVTAYACRSLECEYHIYLCTQGDWFYVDVTVTVTWYNTAKFWG